MVFNVTIDTFRQYNNLDVSFNFPLAELIKNVTQFEHIETFAFSAVKVGI